MTMLYFLEASVPLTKVFSVKNGSLTKTPYPMTWEFTSHKEQCSDLKTLERLLVKHAALGHCLIKGELKKDLVRESRAGMTDSQATTTLLCLDLDGLPETATLDVFLAEMGLQDISYVVQWSASFGINDQRLRAHVFMYLDKAHAAPLLKQWLIQKNHAVPLLHGAMELTKTGSTIRWPLDISACQNDKLIYIAPPILKGIKDPMGKQPRIQYVKHKYDVLAFDQAINSTEKNKQLTHARINDLRDVAGIPKRRFNYKVTGGMEVMLKPDESVITEMKSDRGFVYFNLNGGDSWAYYHPEDRADYIFNFKGEPAYLTKELLPDYWAELTKTTTRISSSGIRYLAFCDRKTAQYWTGKYDTTNDILDINPTKNETQLRDFCKQHGVQIGDFVPQWDLVFDPQDNVRVDVENRIVNRFTPSQYMKQPVKKRDRCPSTIFKVMHSALGSDVDITERFINWLACILQNRDRTTTAWVMHGVSSTGKGVLTSKILHPLFAPHMVRRRMEDLGEKYNDFMKHSLIVVIDEMQVGALSNERGVMAKLFNFISEESVSIRVMHANSVEVRNYSNWIFLSNKPDPVTINRGDDRFNIGKYQPVPLILSDVDIKRIEDELQAFHDFLMCYPADTELARQVIQSQDRDNMMAVSEAAVDTVSAALIDGNFEFFLDALPTNQSYQLNALTRDKVEDYISVLKLLMVRTKGAKCNVSREELRTLYDYTVGNMPASPNKFTSLLKHHRIHTSRVWVNDKTVHGIAVTWRDAGKFEEYASIHFPAPTKAKTKSKP